MFRQELEMAAILDWEAHKPDAWNPGRFFLFLVREDLAEGSPWIPPPYLMDQRHDVHLQEFPAEKTQDTIEERFSFPPSVAAVS